MKLRYITGLLLATAACAMSCTLEEDPKGKLTNGTFFASQEDLNMSVYSLYNVVAQHQCSSAGFEAAFQGNDITTNPGSNKQHFAEIDAFHVTDGNMGVERLWNGAYSAIKAANNIIDNADKAQAPEEEKNIAIGQAKFWRAYFYFYLVRNFGDIPMPLTVGTDYNRSKATVKEVYEQIEKDLTDCIASLPVSYERYGAPRFANGVNSFITKQAAQAMLVPVYMARAGWPLKQTEYYGKAATLAKELIDKSESHEYEFILENDYKDVYAYASNNYTNETMLGFDFHLIGNWAPNDSEFSSCDGFQSLGDYAGWGDDFGAIRFWKEFPGGPRKDAVYSKQILVPGAMLGGVTGQDDKLFDWYDDFFKTMEYQPQICNKSYSVTSADQCWATGAYVDYDYTLPPYLGMVSDARNRLIRYAEMLLWYAESQARADGSPNAFARQCLNRVRNRAGLGDWSGPDSEFADACVQEHGWEVACYWMAVVTRRDDMMRMELLEKHFNERKANVPIEVAPGIKIAEKVLIPESVTWQGEKSIYMPYPALDRNLNPNLQ